MRFDCDRQSQSTSDAVRITRRDLQIRLFRQRIKALLRVLRAFRRDHGLVDASSSRDFSVSNFRTITYRSAPLSLSVTNNRLCR